MNDQLQATINEALKQIMSALQSGGSFVSSQLPLLLQEKLAYDFYYDLSEIVLWLLLTLVSWWLLVSYYRKNRNYTDSARFITAYITVGAISFITFIVVYHNLGAMAEIHFAPRLYLLEWLKDVVKG